MATDSMAVLKENMFFFQEDVLGFYEKTKTQISNISVDKEITRCAIEQLFDSIKDEIERKQKQMLSGNDILHEQFLVDAKYRNKEAKNVLKEMRDLQEDLEAGTDDEKRVRGLQDRYDELQSSFVRLQLNSPVIRFDTMPEDEAALKRLAFAKISMETDSGAPLNENELIKDMKPRSFATSRQNEMFHDNITSFVWREQKLIVTDKSNKKLKVFTEDGEFLNEHHLNDMNISPYGICHTGETAQGDTFAVTAPKHARILLFVMDADGVLSRSGNFRTHVGYAGIARGIKAESLVVSLVSTKEVSRIDIIGYRGEIFRMFHANSYGQPLFAFPRYVVTNLNTIIVSDLKKGCVSFLNEANGNILAEYHGNHDHPLKEPYDLAVDKKGYVYVMDGNTGHIHVIDLQCKLVEVIVEFQNESQPRLLSFDKEQNKIAVNYNTGYISLAPTAVLRRHADEGNQPPTFNLPTAPSVTSTRLQQPPTSDGDKDQFLSPPSYDRAVMCPSPGF